jgi:hypothetical protein
MVRFRTIGACFVVISLVLFIVLCQLEVIPLLTRRDVKPSPYPSALFEQQRQRVPAVVSRSLGNHGRTIFLTYGAGKMFTALALERADQMRATHAFDDVRVMGPQDIDADFYARHAKVLKQKEGAGLYLWKPYIVYKVYESMEVGDVLVYLDAGQRWKSTESMTSWIDRCQTSANGGVVFETEDTMGSQTKGDLFVASGLDLRVYEFFPQIWAGLFFLQKRESDSSTSVTADWLKLSTMPHALDHERSRAPNSKLFRRRYHRHDQSVWSLVAYPRAFDRVASPDWPVVRVKDAGHYNWQRYKREWMLNWKDAMDRFKS